MQEGINSKTEIESQVERNVWVHALNQERTSKGEFCTLYKDKYNYN